MLLPALLLFGLVQAEPPAAPATAPAPVPDPEIEAWYQDMRLACRDRRTLLLARAEARGETAPFTGGSVLAVVTAAALVSMAGGGEPQIGPQALPRAPEPDDFAAPDPRTGLPAAEAAPALLPEQQALLQAIELAQTEADEAWRAWRASPEPGRPVLLQALERLRGLCAGVTP